MKISTVLLAAAMGGALVGAVGCGETAHPATDPSAAAGSMPATSGAPAAPGAKHACKGQNACKGQGGCKSDKNA